MPKKYISEDLELMKEWNWETNTKEGLDPNNLSCNSNQKAWWKCSKCGYSWYSVISNRHRNHTGCPACAYKVLAKGYNDLETRNPNIAKDWHPTKNGSLKPSDFNSASLYRAWWLCPICNHSYQKRIMDRVKKGAKCNHCCDPKVIQGKNDIASKFPEILKEWDYKKNDPFQPQNFSYGTKRKFWWICSECGFSWQSTPLHRAISKSGCPKCTTGSFAIAGETDLATTHPNLAKEWDYTKNGDLTPQKVKAGSNHYVWWKCPTCHCSYKAQICTRTRGRNCPNCNDTGLVVGYNDFQTLHPDLAQEWHPTKNTKKPNQIKAKSQYKAFWLCPTCGLVWKTSVRDRVNYNRNCPACNDTSLVPGVNDLGTKFPEIAKEWHPTKNGDLTPRDVKSFSGKRVWWKCNLCHHAWETSVSSRTSQLSGCPRCLSSKQTSYPEQAIYYYVQKLYPDALNKYRSKFLERMELDIFIPSINYAIEYDGEAWHKQEKRWREQKKYRLCHKKGIKLIRIREEMAPLGSDIADQQISIVELNGKKSLEETIKYLIKRINFTNKRISIDLTKDEKTIRSICQGKPKNSLEKIFPDIAKEWHPTMNGELQPDRVFCSSHYRAWWLCPKCKQPYQCSVNRRTTMKSGCPVCSSKKVVPGINDLETTHPELAIDWHPTKNGNKTPRDITFGSGKKYWWLCHKCKHEWQESPNRRTTTRSGENRDCPVCSGKKLMPGINDLGTICPELSKEWHPTKNGNLTPRDVKAGSHYTVWWQCLKCGHEWKTDIRSRVKGRKCPNCHGLPQLPL